MEDYKRDFIHFMVQSDAQVWPVHAEERAPVPSS